MGVWEAVISVVGAALMGAIGYVLGRIFTHEIRITRLETLIPVEFRHLSADVKEIKAALLRRDRQE